MEGAEKRDGVGVFRGERYVFKERMDEPIMIIIMTLLIEEAQLDEYIQSSLRSL